MDVGAIPPIDPTAAASAAQRADAANAVQPQPTNNDASNNGQSVQTVSQSTGRLVDIFA